MLKQFNALIIYLLLPGCLGSYAVLDENIDQDIQFPNLQTVPDRPFAPDFERVRSEETKLKQDQQQELDLNQKLRQQIE